MQNSVTWPCLIFYIANTVSPALDPQSFNTRSMSELNLLMSTASQKPHEEHIVDGDLYGRGKKRPKHGTEVTQMHSLGS